MNKVVLVITILLSFLVSLTRLNAQINSENLKQILKRENIEPKFDELIVDENQVYVDFFGKLDDAKTKQFLNFLNDNYNQYGVFFKLRFYETNFNDDNLELMNNVIDYLKADVKSSTFILIGDTYFVDYEERLNDNLISVIQEAYRIDNSKRVDKLKIVLKKYYRNESLMIFIVLSSLFLIIFTIIFLSIKNKNIK